VQLPASVVASIYGNVSDGEMLAFAKAVSRVSDRDLRLLLTMAGRMGSARNRSFHLRYQNHLFPECSNCEILTVCIQGVG
jgi:hypothetical protein